MAAAWDGLARLVPPGRVQSQLSTDDREEHARACEAVRSHLFSVDAAELCAELKAPQRISMAREVLQFTFAALHAAGDPDEDVASACTRMRARIMNAVLEALQSGPASENAALGGDLVKLLKEQLDEELGQQQICKVVSVVLGCVEEGQPCVARLLDLLPPAITLLLSMKAPDDEAEEEGGAAHVHPGIAQRDSAMLRIGHAEWKQEHITALLATLRDTPMTDVQRRDMGLKALRACRTADIQLLPAITYQLLLMPKLGAKGLVLRGLVSLFDHLDTQHRGAAHSAVSNSAPRGGAGGAVVLQQVIGTVLLHICGAVKFDTSLAQEWVKSLRSAVVAPSPFALALLFSLCQQSKLQEAILPMLKRMAAQAFEFDTQKVQRSWMATLPQLPQLTGMHLQAALMQSVRGGTETAVPGIVALAEQLLVVPPDCALQLVRASTASPGAGEGCADEVVLPAGVRMPLLGMRVLQAAFEAHPEARAELLRVCQAKLCCATRLEHALPYILLLANLARRNHANLYSHTQRLKDCLQNFLALPGDGALALLLALWPLCRARRELQDHTVLLLRKVMFSRDVGARLVAVRGFLHIITEQQLRVEPAHQAAAAASGSGHGSCSQACGSEASGSQMSHRPALASGAGVSLLHEMLGFLRKSLGQQAAVRTVLYAELHNLLLADPDSRDCIIELVLPHFTTFFDPEENSPPLRVDMCSSTQGDGEAHLVEPLPALLGCVRRLVAFSRGQGLNGSATTCGSQDDMDTDAHTPTKELGRMFDSVRTRLLECVNEHFGLEGDATELSLSTTLGCLNQLKVANLLGCLEVVMEDVVHQATGPHSSGSATETGDSLLKACDLHQRLYALVANAKVPVKTKGQGSAEVGDDTQEGGGGGGGGGGGKRAREKVCADVVAIKDRVPALSPACLAKMCIALVDGGLVHSTSASAPAGVPSHAKVARSGTFQSFALRGCLNTLEAACSSAALSTTITECLASDPRGQRRTCQPDWLQLAGPLMLACQTLLYVWTGKAKEARGAGGEGAAKRAKKGVKGAGAARAAPVKDPFDGVALLAATCVKQLVSMAGTVQHLALILGSLPVPTGATAVRTAAGCDAAGVSAEEAEALATVAVRLPHFQIMLQKLMSTSSFKEAVVLVECMHCLGHMLPATLALRISDMALLCCQQRAPEVTHDRVARALLELHVELRGPDSLSTLLKVASEAQDVIGAQGQETQAQVHQSYPIIQDHTKHTAVAAVLDACDTALAELGRLLAITAGMAALEVGETGVANLGAARHKLDASACLRLEHICWVLVKVVNTRLGSAVVLDRQTLVLAAFYKTLATMAKLALPVKGSSTAVSPELRSLVTLTNRDLTPTVYVCIYDTQDCAQQDVGQDVEGKEGKAARLNTARIKKELKSLPKLVFELEDAEKRLLLLSKATHIAALAPVKRSANRGFKLAATAPQE